MGAEFQLEMMTVKAEMGGGCGHTTVQMCFVALIGHSKGKITSSTLCVFYGNKKKRPSLICQLFMEGLLCCKN